MSLVYITHHDENVYNYGREKASEDVKPPIYKSKAGKAAKISKPDTKRIEPNTFILTSTNRYTHKTMGYAETPLYAPCDYLRKNEGVRFRRKTDHVCFHKELPPIPDFDPCHRTPEKPQRDFKMKNIKAVVCRSPRRPLPRYAFTRTGDVRLLCNSGLMPAYVFRPNYGKVPKYIVASKRANEEAMALERQQKPTGYTLISPEERLELLAGLKANWQAMQRNFQLLPVLTDTPPKKKRKWELEKDLRNLEKDILLVESNPLIYVCDAVPECIRGGSKPIHRKKNLDVSTEACLKY